MTAKNLLVELFVEELPPKALKTLGETFAQTLAKSLHQSGLAASDATVTPYASPRRLAAHITDVLPVAADKPVTQKLMPVAVGLDAAGQPTPALLKKLASVGADASVESSVTTSRVRFRDLTDKNLRRGIFGSVPELIASIESYLNAHNADPKPYVWTATAESILAKVRRARTKLQQVVNQN